MQALLIVVAEWLLKNAVRTMLVAAGLALTTTAGSLYAINVYLDRLLSQANSISTETIQLLALSGFHIAFSMVIGAVTWRITLNSTSNAVKLVSKS